MCLFWPQLLHVLHTLICTTRQYDGVQAYSRTQWSSRTPSQTLALMHTVADNALMHTLTANGPYAYQKAAQSVCVFHVETA